MKTASKNTDVKQTLARGSAKMLRKLAIIAARSKGAGGGVATPRKAKNATMVTINPNEPRIANTPRQPNMSPITPRDRGADDVAGKGYGKQPADGHLAHSCIQVHVTELSQTARGAAASLHSSFFYLGQAVGPVVYGYGFAHGGP